MEEAWSYLWNKLFYEETGLFYDYLTSREHEKRFSHLPQSDEIEKQFPNPCGWGTGMEDSMLNAGSVMEVLRLRKEMAADKESLSLAKKVLGGMLRCTYSHGVPGFVARSISPWDKRSCYANSSRDQFTLCVYGAWRFLRSFQDADEKDLKDARQLLVDIATYCELVVTPENADNLLRLDGKPGLVCHMLDVRVHEIMRLPMFYAAAWDASGDHHWFDLYRRYAIPGIEENLRLDPAWPWWDVEFSQMQLSLALLAEVESDDELRGKYLRAMFLTAELSNKYFEAEIRKGKTFSGDWSSLNHNWRQMPLALCGTTIQNPEQSSLYGGYAYVQPQFPSSYMDPYSILRALGNLMYTQMLCQDWTPKQEVLESFLSLAAKPDYKTHGSDGPINILHGYWIGRYRKVC